MFVIIIDFHDDYTKLITCIFSTENFQCVSKSYDQETNSMD